MIASGNAMWDSLSLEMKYEVATLSATWRSRHAGRIKQGMSTRSSEVSDNDLTMVTASNDDTLRNPMPMHVGLTIEQAQAHYDAAMVKEEDPVPAPMSAVL
ncbi:NHL repeat-containing protein 2 [Hordeum vulgare]|nr:NHL repeat-containing protein 2 [Hordeum vulgare]